MDRAANRRLLEGLRLLVVEDDAMLAIALDMTLTDLGCEIVGLASNLAEALALAREAMVDGAILDVNLAGEMVFPAADVLAERGIPFAFTTGYGLAGLRECDRTRPVLQKPYEVHALTRIASGWCKPAVN